MLKTIFTTILLAGSLFLHSQVCQTGALFVTGSGCGCSSGCDLTALGGPNCGGGTGGNCSAGYLLMSTTITIPATCGVSIVAEMKPRPGCSAGGADGNSTTTDRLRIRNTVGPVPPWQIGGSNSSLIDNLIITGPATIIIEGAANRADEIITYSISFNSGPCSCSQILPITLLNFSGERVSNEINILRWSTSSEINNDFFTVEKSSDGFTFNEIETIKGAGNSNIVLNYNFIDNSPLQSVNYYKLKQTDFNGDYSYSDIIALNNSKNDASLFISNHMLQISLTSAVSNGTIQIFDALGQIVHSENITDNKQINTSNFAKGIYIVKVTTPIATTIQKVNF